MALLRCWVGLVVAAYGWGVLAPLTSSYLFNRLILGHFLRMTKYSAAPVRGWADVATPFRWYRCFRYQSSHCLTVALVVVPRPSPPAPPQHGEGSQSQKHLHLVLILVPLPL